jgi:hypothetical protein
MTPAMRFVFYGLAAYNVVCVVVMIGIIDRLRPSDPTIHGLRFFLFCFILSAIVLGATGVLIGRLRPSARVQPPAAPAAD